MEAAKKDENFRLFTDSPFKKLWSAAKWISFMLRVN